jgi:predicted dehydrogenase
MVQISREGAVWENYPVPEGFERNWLFMDEMRHFVAVSQGIENPICSLEDGIWALRLALGAHQSILAGEKILF